MPRPYCSGPASIWVGIGRRDAVLPRHDNSHLTRLTAILARESRQQGGSVIATPAGIGGHLLSAVLSLLGGGTDRAPVLLGTCQERPIIDLVPSYRKVTTDASGGRDGPGEDELFLWEEGFIQATLTVWNEAVYSWISSRPRPGAFRGAFDARDVGTMMVRERRAYPIWVDMPYGAFEAGRTEPQPPGYHFYAGFLVAPDRIEPGTRPKKISLLWHCKPSPPIKVGNEEVRVVYDHDMREIRGQSTSLLPGRLPPREPELPRVPPAFSGPELGPGILGF